MYACKIPWSCSLLISTAWVYAFRVTNNTLIVLPPCPSLSLRPLETSGEVWQLPRRKPGAPPTVFPWCDHVHKPAGGWSELSLVLIITGSSSQHSQIILLACIHTPKCKIDFFDLSDTATATPMSRFLCKSLSLHASISARWGISALPFQ